MQEIKRIRKKIQELRELALQSAIQNYKISSQLNKFATTETQKKQTYDSAILSLKKAILIAKELNIDIYPDLIDGSNS